MEILGILFFVIAIMAVLFGIFLLIDEGIEGLLVIMAGVGFFFMGIGIMNSAGESYQTEVQQAADHQGIEVTANYMGDNIATKSPCKIGLDLQNGELVMHGTNNVVTKDKLESICATLAN